MGLNGKNTPKSTAYAPRNAASPTRTSTSPARAADPNLNGKVLHLNTDITTLRVDAIVNAAKQSLGGGAGVDGAIHKAAGPSLRRECLTLGGCAIGSAKITRAYNLPCQRVIHAVGPVYYDHSPAQAERFLRGCYRTSLQLAVENGCKTVAFSSISTGIYGYPKVTATEAAVSEVKSFLTGPDGQSIDKVIFCTFLDDEVTAAYNRILPRYFPPTDDDLGGETSFRNRAAGGGAEGQKSSESLAAALPHPPTTEPKSLEEPTAKKQKVAASSDEVEIQAEGEDEFEGFADNKSHDGNPLAISDQNIDEGWEDVGKDKDLAEMKAKSKPIGEEPVDIGGTKDKIAKVLEANGEVAGQAAGVPNMLTKDW